VWDRFRGKGLRYLATVTVPTLGQPVVILGRAAAIVDGKLTGDATVVQKVWSPGFRIISINNLPEDRKQDYAS